MRLPRFPLAALALAAALCFGAAAARAQDCVAVMSQIPELSTFVNALNRTGLTDLLRGPGPFTILAPTNQAIERVPINIRNDLMGTVPTESIDPIRGPAVLNAHIIDGKHLSSEVQGQNRVTMRTRNGNQLIIQRQSDGHYSLTPGPGGFGAGGRNQIPPAHVLRTDIPCSNGVVHIVDNVLAR